jgi:hypothetical protein
VLRELGKENSQFLRSDPNIGGLTKVVRVLRDVPHVPEEIVHERPQFFGWKRMTIDWSVAGIGVLRSDLQREVQNTALNDANKLLELSGRDPSPHPVTVHVRIH